MKKLFWLLSLWLAVAAPASPFFFSPPTLATAFSNLHSGSFNGTTAYLNLGNNLDNDGSQAQSFTIRMRPAGNTGVGRIWAKLSSTTSIGWSIAQVNQNIRVVYSSSSGATNAIIVDAVSVLNAGTSVTLGVTYTGSKTAAGVGITINGVAQSTTTVQDNFSTSSSNTTDCNIGSIDNGAAGFFNGILDEMAEYTVALSVPTQLSIYNSGVANDISGVSGLGHWYRFENTVLSPVDSSSTIFDRKGAVNATNNNVTFSTTLP